MQNGVSYIFVQKDKCRFLIGHLKVLLYLLDLGGLTKENFLSTFIINFYTYLRDIFLRFVILNQTFS